MNRIVLILAALALVLTACGGDTTTAEPASTEVAADSLPQDWGEILTAETDCDALDEHFDTLFTVQQARHDAGDTETAEAFTAAMEFADQRMAEEGCEGY